MKLFSLGVLLFALTFCGLSDRIKQMSGGSNGNSASSNGGNTSKTERSFGGARKAYDRAAGDHRQRHRSSLDDQGLSWRLPSGWKKMDVKKVTFNYAVA